MRYVSFSLWGDKPIYNVGAIRNSELVSKFYPGWKMVVYYDESVPAKTITELDKNSVLLKKVEDNSIYGMFWRFFAADIPDCEYAIIRDADSRITYRESLAVNEWIESGLPVHVMRDHPYHEIPAGTHSMGITGGMWGIKGNIIPITKMISDFENSKNHTYGIDQTFLIAIYEKFKGNICVHDEFFEKKPFPIKRENGRFVGERIDENDNPLFDDYKLVL